MVDDNNASDSTENKPDNSWHRLLARLLELVLSPVDIDVQSDVSVTKPPLDADILLLRRKTPQWTAAQRARLPDGIRDSKAPHILIELKYTQSFNEEAFTQALCYDWFYKEGRQLRKFDVQTVLLLAKPIEMMPEKVTELGKQLEEAWLARLTVDDVLARFGQDELLSHIKPVDRLAGLEPDVIEEYLKQFKKQQD
ncbi:MAG: hypothetical protein B6247_17835 [Candidatus Parabeggiatoa sp. nov. 2]|nr:MAG: hypothetical protein B6247_17835 [Beggiatoa sp. 4572_84]